MAQVRLLGHKMEDPVHDRPIYLALLLTLVWAPLPLGSNRVWAIGILLLAVTALLMGSAWVWRGHLAGAARLLAPFRWPIGLLAAMAAWIWFQTVPLPASWVQLLSPLAAQAQDASPWMRLTLDLHQTHIAATLAFIYLSAFVVTVLTIRDSHRLERLAMTLVVSGLLQSIIGAVLFSMKAEYRIFFVDVSHQRMLGTFVYQNSMAGYLCMCLSIGIGLMLGRLDGKTTTYPHWKARVTAMVGFALSPKMRLRLFLVIMVIALVLTRSRMGNSAFFASMLVVGLMAVILARKTAPQTIALILSLIVIDVLVVGTGVGLEKVVQRIQQTELSVEDGGREESVEARTEAARTALPIVQDYPVAGTGGGSFYGIFLSYRTPKYGYAYLDHAHNDYVEIAADYGLVGLGILATLVGLTLVTVMQVIAKRRSRIPWGIGFGAAMAMVCLLIHSTVDFNLHIPSNALTITVVLAMGWIAKVVPSKRAGRDFRQRAAPEAAQMPASAAAG